MSLKGLLTHLIEVPHYNSHLSDLDVMVKDLLANPERIERIEKASHLRGSPWYSVHRSSHKESHCSIISHTHPGLVVKSPFDSGV